MKKIALVFLLISSFFALDTKNAFAAAPEPIIETEHIYQLRGEGDQQKKCNLFSSCVEENTDVIIELSGISYDNGTVFPDGETIGIDLIAKERACRNTDPGYEDGTWFGWKRVKVENGSANLTIPGKFLRAACSYKIEVTLPKNAGDVTGTKKNVMVYPYSQTASLRCDDSDAECKTNLDSVASYELCSQIKKDTDQFTACKTCFESQGIWTAVGCIPSDPESVITTIITIGLAAGGGIVLIMILVGSFMLSVSQGDPNKTKEAKEIITSAIIGLLFVIFSVTILQFIGVEILHIPGFGES